MPSAIDITKPIYGTPTTQSVRDNFHIARDEITVLQNLADEHVNRDGDTMTGPLLLYGDPYAPNEATTLSWVLRQLHSTVNTLVYIGDYDGANDIILSSGVPQFIVGTALPPASAATSQYYFTVKTSHGSPGLGHQPPEGVTAGTFLISNGVMWHNFAMTAADITAKTTPIDEPPIPNVPGANVYDALYGIGQNFLLRSGGTLTGFLTLHAAPTADFHASNKKYIDDKVAALVYPNEAPIDAYAYARANAAWTNYPKFDKLIIQTNTWGHLVLDSTTASATANQIAFQKDGQPRWFINGGDWTTDQNFNIARYNNAGTNPDPTGYVLNLNRANGSMILSGGLIYLDPPVGAGAPSIYGRGVNNPTTSTNDGLAFIARNIVGNPGGVLALRGPTYPSPNIVEIFTGVNFAKNFMFHSDGSLRLPGYLYMAQAGGLVFDSAYGYPTIVKDSTGSTGNWIFTANPSYRFWFGGSDSQWHWDGPPNFENKILFTAAGGITLKQTLNAGGDVIGIGIVQANGYVMSGGGGYYVAWNNNYGLYRNGSAAWNFIENGQWNCSITSDGRITARTHLFAGGNVYALNDWTFALCGGGNLKFLQFTTNYYFAFDTTTGSCYYYLYNQQLWMMRSDWWAYNNVGPVGGHGAFQDLSDVRVKTDISDSEVGLKEVLALKPISFRRIRNIKNPGPVIDEKFDIGFSAQQVQMVIPEAVNEIGIELPDGTGKMDSGNPTLSLGTTAIVAALVNSVKELTARLTVLEGTK